MNRIMRFYFVQDHKRNYRFFSSEPVSQPDLEFSRLKRIWEEAKKKLMLLPRRILSQEQAFDRIGGPEAKEISIYHSGRLSAQKIHKKFHFFLRKQKTKHLSLLVLETIVLPISGLMALLPGPNVFFGVLALIMYTHWRALKGLNRLSKKELRFLALSVFASWEEALKEKSEEEILRILEEMEQELEHRNLRKILWK